MAEDFAFCDLSDRIDFFRRPLSHIAPTTKERETHEEAHPVSCSATFPPG